MEREFRGNSIIALPEDFVVIDTETTGLDFECCNIIEISAIRYKSGKASSSFSSLVKPPIEEIYFPFRGENGEIVRRYVDEFIEDLTGITNEMLETAPEITDVLPEFLGFIEDSILIGHNVSFDINFLYDATAKCGLAPLSNDFINTVRLAHKVFPGNSHYRLSDVAEFCGFQQDSAHRALADCETTAECYLHMRTKALEKMTEAEFAAQFKKKTTSYSEYASQIDSEKMEVDEDSPIYGKTIVFTGTLDRMPRKQAMELVAKLGATPADSITKETNYLVIGNGEFVKSVKNGKTKKMQKAEAMACKGIDIRVISEKAFFDIIEM